ncbi:MAG: hypothetical protein V9E96_00250 [Chitinophagaceae bacterium]
MYWFLSYVLNYTKPQLAGVLLVSCTLFQAFNCNVLVRLCFV